MIRGESGLSAEVRSIIPQSASNERAQVQGIVCPNDYPQSTMHLDVIAALELIVALNRPNGIYKGKYQVSRIVPLHQLLFSGLMQAQNVSVFFSMPQGQTLLESQVG